MPPFCFLAEQEKLFRTLKTNCEGYPKAYGLYVEGEIFKVAKLLRSGLF